MGTAVVGALIATLVVKVLPDGIWSHHLVASFFHGERTTFAALAIVVSVLAGWGALSLTDSHSVDEHG